jgi:hypothetical protein
MTTIVVGVLSLKHGIKMKMLGNECVKFKALMKKPERLS